MLVNPDLDLYPDGAHKSGVDLYNVERSHVPQVPLLAVSFLFAVQLRPGQSLLKLDRGSVPSEAPQLEQKEDHTLLHELYRSLDFIPQVYDGINLLPLQPL